MSFEILWEPHGAIKRFWGHVSGPEFLAAHSAISQDERLDNIRYVINDFTDATSHSISEEQIVTYYVDRQSIAAYMPSIRGAFVAKTPAMTGLSEMINARFATNHRTRVFSSVEDARKWLS
jgi:hypothetical protein